MYSHCRIQFGAASFVLGSFRNHNGRVVPCQCISGVSGVAERGAILGSRPFPALVFFLDEERHRAVPCYGAAFVFGRYAVQKRAAGLV